MIQYRNSQLSINDFLDKYYYMAETSVAKAGELISGTITGAAKGLGDTIGTLTNASGLNQVVLAPGLDVESFANGLKSAPDTGIGATLGKITGIDVSQILGIPSQAKIKNLIGSYLGGLQGQIALEVQRCIENHLLALLNKVPEISLVLNIEQVITNAIAGERIKIERKIAKEINELAFQKLKVQQIALYKQKIAEAVRNACPATSPRNISLYQANSLEIIKKAAAVAAKTTAEIQEDAVKQAEGFNGDDPEKYTEVDTETNTVKQKEVTEQPLSDFDKIKGQIKNDLELLLKHYQDFNKSEQYVQKGFFTKSKFLYNISDYKTQYTNTIDKFAVLDLIQAEFEDDDDNPIIISASPETAGKDFPQLTRSQQKLFDRMKQFAAVDVQRSRLEIKSDIDKLIKYKLKRHIGEFNEEGGKPKEEGTDFYIDPQLYTDNKVEEAIDKKAGRVREVSSDTITLIETTLYTYS